MKAYMILISIIINRNFCYSQQLNNEQVNNETKTEFYAPIYSLYYPTAKWELTLENAEFLNLHVVQRPNQQNLIIYLEGHTDDVGDYNYNMLLSQKRAQAAADYLKSKGFSEDQIKISYFGKSKPETRKLSYLKSLKTFVIQIEE